MRGPALTAADGMPLMGATVAGTGGGDVKDRSSRSPRLERMVRRMRWPSPCRAGLYSAASGLPEPLWGSLPLCR
jgi:hypothetical protein